jgi:Cu(I)/Ag(I) efflux system periplasmic protein CusF
MKTRHTLRLALTALAGGFVVLSGITSVPGASNWNFSAGSSISAMELLQGVFAPALVMAQTLVEGKGKVIAVTPEKQELVLEHGAIKGFMDAMTMGYKVSSPALLKGLKSGDQVQFTIDSKKSVITKIAKVKN